MSLREYKTRRNFRRTKEPPGRRSAARAGGPFAFVVQKHAASHLHYDFRLEMEGVLKSWAVPKGFPFRRGERRLAVQVEDHPLEYGGFEGIIPEGNYGAGTVMLWDRGTYVLSGNDPHQALATGKIHLRLRGKKLRGEWTLVRMRRSDGAKPQWLLLKSGSDLEPLSSRQDDRSALSRRSMAQISGAADVNEWQSNRNAGRDRSATRGRSAVVRAPVLTRSRSGPRLPAGRSTGHRESPERPLSVSAAGLKSLDVPLDRLPARSPKFVEPMKTLLVDSLPRGSQWIYEIKFDGVRALGIKDGHSVRLYSRAGNDLGEKYGAIVQALKRLPVRQVVLDGEVVAVDPQGRSAFQLLQTYPSARGTKPPLFYYIFDAIGWEGKDLAGLPLWQRKKLAEAAVKGSSGPLRSSEAIQADAPRLMKEMRARGLEGLIAKKKDSLYEPGRRSGAWVKFKWTNEQEFVIGGYTRPQGARSHFGAILVGYYDDDRLKFAAKVGTGFNEKTLRSLYQRFQALATPQCPFANLPERFSGGTGGLSPAEMRRCSWIKPELVCQVRFAEWTRDRHLRQPAFLGLREDKPAREVVREMPQP